MRAVGGLSALEMKVRALDEAAGGGSHLFANDKAPGDASGNGFKDVGIWKAATLGACTSSSSAGGGYGY